MLAGNKENVIAAADKADIILIFIHSSIPHILYVFVRRCRALSGTAVIV